MEIWGNILRESTMTMNTSASHGSRSGGEDAADRTARRLAVLKRLRIVVRAAQGHSARIEKQCGIGGAQLWLLQELYDQPGFRVGEIAQRMAIHQSSVSNLLDTLTKKGYVTRVRDSIDLRAVKLDLTEAGRQLVEQAPIPARGLLPAALDRLDDEGLMALAKALQGLLGVIEDVDEQHALLPLPFTM
jgi:DNA-binding MarR family transcriptional regulator